MMTWLPLAISGVSLVIAIISLCISAKGLHLSQEEFFASRTTILSCSVRPNLSQEDIKGLGSNDPALHAESARRWAQGFIKGFIAFVPSMKPNFIHECSLSLPQEIGKHHELTVSNISSGSITRKLVSMGVIDEGDFGVPYEFLIPKLHQYLRKITPDRHKVQRGTLNQAAVPLVVGLQILAKGKKYCERQLYHLSLGYQVAEDGECLVTGLSMDYKRRLSRREKTSKVLSSEMSQAGVKFLSEPLPVEGSPTTESNTTSG